MRKSIEFSAKFDTKEFDQAVEKMQRKLKDVYAPQDMARMQGGMAQRLGQNGMPGAMSAPSQEAFMKATQQSRRELDQLIKEQAQGQEKLGKIIAQRGEFLKKLKDQQIEMNKGSQEELTLKEKIARVEENNFRLREMYAAKHVALGRALDQKSGGGSGQPPGMNDMAAGSGGGGGPSLGNILKGVSSTLAMLATGAAIYDQYSGIPMQRSASLGSMTQNLVGQPLQDLSNGQVVGAMAYAPERQRAMGMAQDRMNNRRLTDTATAISGIGGIADGVGSAFGMSDGRSWNLMMSSVTERMSAMFKNVPIMGDIPGFKQVFQSAGDKFEKISDTYASGYASKLAEKFGQDYQQNLDSEIKKNPLKNLAVNYLQGNYQQNLSSQRMLGLGDDEFYGNHGFLEGANKAGFTGDMAQQMAQQIQGAGGSTRGERGSVMALEAQRGFGLTNAGSVYGRISGGAGSSQASDSVFKKLLEESVKNGLDRSEFREEQRKFADITSEILSKSGVNNSEDAEKVLQGFSRFLGGSPTMKDVSGAKSAYDEYQNQSAETGGRMGALQFSGLMNAGLSGIGAAGLGGLMEMPEQDVNANNPYIISKAVQAKMSPKDLVAAVLKQKREASLQAAQLDPSQMDSLNQYMTSNGLPSTLNEEQLKSMPEDMQAAYQASEEGAVRRYGYSDPQKREAAARGFRSGQGAIPMDVDVEGKLTGDTGLSGDAVVKASGVAAQAMLENFRNFKTEITPASDALDVFTKKLIIMTQALNMIPDKDRGDAAQYVGQQLFGTGAKMQPQSGKPKK